MDVYVGPFGWNPRHVRTYVCIRSYWGEETNTYARRQSLCKIYVRTCVSVRTSVVIIIFPTYYGIFITMTAPGGVGMYTLLVGV